MLQSRRFLTRPEVTWQIFLKNVLLRPWVTDIPESTAMNPRPSTFPRTSCRLQTAPKTRLHPPVLHNPTFQLHLGYSCGVAEDPGLQRCDAGVGGWTDPDDLAIAVYWTSSVGEPMNIKQSIRMTLEHEDLTILRNTCTSPLTKRNGAKSHKTRTLHQFFHETHHLDFYFMVAIISESSTGIYKTK